MKNIMKKTYITPQAEAIIARPAQMLCGSLLDDTLDINLGEPTTPGIEDDETGYGEAW